MGGKKIAQRMPSKGVQASPMQRVQDRKRETRGSIQVVGKTRVTEGPAANGSCNVTSIAGRRLGLKR